MLNAESGFLPRPQRGQGIFAAERAFNSFISGKDNTLRKFHG
jgi:hypothetical protein